MKKIFENEVDESLFDTFIGPASEKAYNCRWKKEEKVVWLIIASLTVIAIALTLSMIY